MKFINSFGKQFTLKPLPKWLPMKARKMALDKLPEPKQPSYTYEIKSPDGKSTFHTSEITQQLIDSDYASETEKRLWIDYKNSLIKFDTLFNDNMRQLVLSHGIKDEVNVDFKKEIINADLGDVSDLEIRVLWILSEVVPTTEDQERLADDLQKLSGVKMADVETLASEFRTDIQKSQS